MSSNLDDPPLSRLFIIGSKLLNEEDFRNAFSGFGNIEEIWVVKDRSTGENKGVTYIKYSRTSEAAAAMEAMNGKCIGNLNRTIRVMIASSRDQGSKRDVNEEEKTQRLFVMVPKSMTEQELHEEFRVYGDIDYATIMRDRDSRESKGFAYVKYFKFSHAAAAFEGCDKKYRAVFAEPKKSNVNKREESPWIPFSKPNTPLLSAPSLPEVNNSGGCKLLAIVSPFLNQDQLWRLFDIVPGLDYCHLRLEGRPRPTRGVASVVYNSPQWAAHAREKIHGLEYPPGNRIIVKPDYSESDRNYPEPARNYNEPARNFNEPARNYNEPARNYNEPGRNFGEIGRNLDTGRVSSEGGKQPDLLQIAETIAQASSLIQAAGLSPDILQIKLGLPNTSKSDDTFCSVPLPEAQPLAHFDTETVARCFIVCSPPNTLSNSVLKDVFSRFGNLIDVYMLNNRNCGFAKYATLESAQNAIKTLHGAEVCGVRLKVLEAEERPDQNRKRQRLEDAS